MRARPLTQAPDAKTSLDLVLVGGGLANGLIAYRLRTLRPEIRLLVVEAGDRLGGNHTWSFHEGDLTPAQAGWLAPFVVHAWPHYGVAFPGRARRIGTGYRSVTSARFHDVIVPALGDAVRLGAVAELAEATRIRLASGEEFRAGAVVDGRGASTSPHLRLGFQKFVGREVRLAKPHGLSGPMLMDATVPQLDGFRFVYVLPFSGDTLLIEDTYYADGPDLDAERLRARIESYAADRGWTIRETLREETGVLPITLAGDVEAFWREGTPGLPRTGLRAGLFHPTTGYSLPEAVRLADLVAAMPVLSANALFEAVHDHAVRRWREQRFFRALNRMLFLAGRPDERYRVMRRFYGFPEPLIARFYAGHLNAADKIRILAGRPPVPVIEALGALVQTRPQA